MTPQQPAPAKCDECGGKGYVYEGEAITGRGPEDVFPEKVVCPECQPAPEGVSNQDLAERISEVSSRIERCIESFGSAPAALREQLSILRELQQRRSGQEWRTIESAPRDGTRVLVCCLGSDGDRTTHEAWWSTPYESAPLKHGCWRYDGGRTMLSAELNDGRFGATHWQPLPPAPAAEKAGAREKDL